MNSVSKDSLQHRINELEAKLAEAQDMFEALKYNKVDALVVNTDKGEEIFTLQGADRPYRIFLEEMNEGAVTVSRDGMILYANKSFAEFISMPLEKIIGTSFYSYADIKDKKTLISLLMKNDSGKAELNFTRSDGSLISLYLSINLLEIAGIEPVLCILATDLTEKKQTEEILASERLARSILENAGEAIVVCDENMKIIRANKAAEQLAGESVLYRNFDDVFPLIDKKRRKISITEISWEEPETEAAVLGKSGEKIHLIINMGRLNGRHEHVDAYVINLTNVTKHITMEELLNASLQEKTILLKEIHHRVKNNLQIISSLLALQSNALKDDSLAEVLNECRNRVSSMAMIHQKLYESKSFSSISLSDYLRDLIPSLCSSYQTIRSNVMLDFPSEDITLTIEAAIPLGLIMNELITNTLKHAFKGYSSGEIMVSLRSKDDEVEIILSDNGTGFHSRMDFYNPVTLGLQLVHTLIVQLGGKIELLDKPGTNIKLLIPVK